MKTKTILSFVLATFVCLLVAGMATAGLAVTMDRVSVDDITLVSNSTTLAGTASSDATVKVDFTATANLTDVKVRVWIEGYKSDITASTARFNVIKDSTYTKSLTLTLPSTKDMSDVDETLTLYVSITDKDNEQEQTYKIRLQRESYTYELLSVDAPSKASAGELVALDVVLKNIGANELEDSFVTASISELGISKKVYFGDIAPTDDCDECDNEDAVERRIYLTIPSDAKTDDYTIEIKAANYDATETVKKTISITGKATSTNGKTDTTDTTDTTTDKDGKLPTSVIVLTIILVVVFVVLLIVLIVLLTKKPAEKSEDFGETSYY